MKVQLIARPQFVGVDTDEFKRCRPDQMQGTDGEKIAEFAGRGCYDSYGKGRPSDEFAANIIEHFHPNVMYHSTYVMWITGVSRNLSHELVRHHVGFSPSQRSTRYVDERASQVIHHPDLGPLDQLPDELRAKIAEADRAWREAYGATIEYMVAMGYDKKTSQGAAARYLPNGIETRLTWSGNAAAFMSMIQRRRVPKVVDTEFRLLSMEMLKIMKQEMPQYFAHMEVT